MVHNKGRNSAAVNGMIVAMQTVNGNEPLFLSLASEPKPTIIDGGKRVSVKFTQSDLAGSLSNYEMETYSPPGMDKANMLHASLRGVYSIRRRRGPRAY
jgi:hypothetical protein